MRWNLRSRVTADYFAAWSIWFVIDGRLDTARQQAREVLRNSQRVHPSMVVIKWGIAAAASAPALIESPRPSSSRRTQG